MARELLGMSTINIEDLSAEERQNLKELAEKSVSFTEKATLAASPTVREVTQGEYCVLLCLEALNKETTAVQIADMVSLTRPRITQIVNSLEHRGFVIRKKDATDRRKINIKISAAGRRMVEKQRTDAIERHEKFLLNIGDDSEEFVRLLGLLSDYLIKKQGL